MMVTGALLPAPGSPWLISSIALLSKAFMYGLNTTEVHGLENLTRILDLRMQPGTKESQNSLITVSNHLSVIDDPLIWGVLPFKYLFAPENHRWSLGSHDICFKNKFTTAFFTGGQVLPTYRLRHSPQGGLFQPLIDKTLVMLTHPSLRDRLATSTLIQRTATTALENSSDPALQDRLVWSLPNRPPAWLHIFPEGQIYQHPLLQMRYFKWGISRLILELPQPPIVLPMFFSGMQNIMHEKRTFPRFIPRAGNQVKITFGEALPLDKWDKVRKRWRDIRDSCAAIGGEEGERLLREGDEAVQLRVEVALMIRAEVENIRVRCGYPPEQPESRLPETYKRDKNLYVYEVDSEKHINS